jgi:ribosomal protein L30E
MVKRNETTSELKELKDKIKEGKVIVGSKEIIKNLKQDSTIVKVYLAKNCPQETKLDLENYTNLLNIDLIELELNNEELGVICKKNFFVSVVAIVN